MTKKEESLSWLLRRTELRGTTRYVELLAAQTGPLNCLCSLEKKIDKATKELKAKTTKKRAKKKPASKK